MTSYKINCITLFAVLILLGCEKNVFASAGSSDLGHNQKEINGTNVPKKFRDTIRIDITDDNKLKIFKNDEIPQELDFFSPIKGKLTNDDIYAQILYEKNNIIINLEIGKNADIYEDIYLSKNDIPIIIERIVRTTIIKSSAMPQKLVCEQKINKPLSSSVYSPLDDKSKKCTTEKLR